MNGEVCLCVIFSNHLITEDVFFHTVYLNQSVNSDMLKSLFIKECQNMKLITLWMYSAFENLSW